MKQERVMEYPREAVAAVEDALLTVARSMWPFPDAPFPYYNAKKHAIAVLNTIEPMLKNVAHIEQMRRWSLEGQYDLFGMEENQNGEYVLYDDLVAVVRHTIEKPAPTE